MTKKYKLPKGLRVVNVEDGPICIEQDDFKKITDEISIYKEAADIQTEIINGLKKITNDLQKKNKKLNSRLNEIQEHLQICFGNDKQVSIPKATFDLLLQQKLVKPHYLIPVYCFYYYTAIWQKTNQPKATVHFVAKGLNLSLTKVRQCKKQLIKMKLIEAIKKRDDGNKITGHYIYIKYLTILTKTDRMEKREANAYSNNKETVAQGKPCTTNSFFPEDEQPKTFSEKCSYRLWKAIHKKNKLKRQVKAHVWVEHFRKLSTEMKHPRIRKVLSWYCKHIGKKYIPQAYSARGFYNKFLQIENAMDRDLEENPPKVKNKKRIMKDGTVEYTMPYKQENIDV